MSEQAAAPAMADIEVNLLYPEKSGVAARLKAAGYAMQWADLSQVHPSRLRGWLYVVEDHNGKPTRFRHGELVLLKKKL